MTKLSEQEYEHILSWASKTAETDYDRRKKGDTVNSTLENSGSLIRSNSELFLKLYDEAWNFYDKMKTSARPEFLEKHLKQRAEKRPRFSPSIFAHWGKNIRSTDDIDYDDNDMSESLDEREITFENAEPLLEERVYSSGWKKTVKLALATLTIATVAIVSYKSGISNRGPETVKEYSYDDLKQASDAIDNVRILTENYYADHGPCIEDGKIREEIHSPFEDEHLQSYVGRTGENGLPLDQRADELVAIFQNANDVQRKEIPDFYQEGMEAGIELFYENAYAAVSSRTQSIYAQYGLPPENFQAQGIVWFQSPLEDVRIVNLAQGISPTGEAMEQIDPRAYVLVNLFADNTRLQAFNVQHASKGGEGTAQSLYLQHQQSGLQLYLLDQQELQQQASPSLDAGDSTLQQSEQPSKQR